jgi:phosphotransferase system enzyme I (PtsI)
MIEPRTLVGLGVSPGIAIGRPVVIENLPPPVVRTPIAEAEVETEVERLRRAAGQAAEHLKQLAEDAAERVGSEYGSIFEAHRLMLEDPALLAEVEQTVRRQAVNAEWALEHVIRRLVAQFEELGDIYLRERQTDLLDVAAQLQRELQGRTNPEVDRLSKGAVVCADEIPPSQAIRLAQSATGFASETGGKTSHTTIIAKSLGIPAVVGVPSLAANVKGARLVIIDGFEGHVIVNPDPALVQVYELRAEEHRRRQQELLGFAHLAAQTVDGHAFELLANIDLVHELRAAQAGGAEGIGLFRS